MITKETNFRNDLGVDSLDAIELLMALEIEFNVSIPDEDYSDVVTIGDAVDAIYNLLIKKFYLFEEQNITHKVTNKDNEILYIGSIDNCNHFVRLNGDFLTFQILSLTPEEIEKYKKID